MKKVIFLLAFILTVSSGFSQKKKRVHQADTMTPEWAPCPLVLDQHGNRKGTSLGCLDTHREHHFGILLRSYHHFGIILIMHPTHFAIFSAFKRSRSSFKRRISPLQRRISSAYPSLSPFYPRPNFVTSSATWLFSIRIVDHCLVLYSDYCRTSNECSFSIMF